MTLVIELSPDIEAGLTALAAAQSLDIREYIRQLIVEQVTFRQVSGVSIANRIAAWEDVHDIPVAPSLSDEAISREHMYGSRG